MKKIYHICLLSILLIVLHWVEARLYKLNTQSSGIIEFRDDDYQCLYDDEQKKVDCYKSSIVDEERLKQVEFAKKEGLKVTCGYGQGEVLVGAYDTMDAMDIQEEVAMTPENGLEEVCSVWVDAQDKDDT